MRILMSRHGEHVSTGGITGGDADPGLTDKGREQARQLGDLIKIRPHLFDTIFTSSQLRARETASTAFQDTQERQFKFVSSENLKEIKHGLTEAMKQEERNAKWEAFEQEKLAIKPRDLFYLWNHTPFKAEKAETFESVRQRVTAEVIKIVKEYKDQCIESGCNEIAFVTHNAVMSSLIMWSQIQSGELQTNAHGMYPMYFQKGILGNCSTAVFECDPNAESPEIKFIEFI